VHAGWFRFRLTEGSLQHYSVLQHSTKYSTATEPEPDPEPEPEPEPEPDVAREESFFFSSSFFFSLFRRPARVGIIFRSAGLDEQQQQQQ